ncbi:MAG TPA: TetR family transcriptional regulator C-terminal domain-containing protein [Dehalococcoidia bacterium]
MARKEELRRRQIIGAMAQCVASEGIDGATMRKVAERTGASTGFITYYYTNKKELMKETLGSAQEHTRERVQSWAGVESGLKFLEALFEVFVLARDPETLPWSFWLDYWAHASREEELREAHADGTSYLRADVEAAIAAGVADGSLRADLEPGVAADFVMALLNGIGVQSALSQGDGFDARAGEIARLALDFLRK